MLLGQANVVRHCALAKACFALAFDSQVQCRECPLKVAPPAAALLHHVIGIYLCLKSELRKKMSLTDTQAGPI